MKTRPAILAAAALLAPLIPLENSLHAQRIPSSYEFIRGGQEVSVFSGYMPLDAGSLELGPKSGPILGARYAIEASGPFFFEGLLTYMPTEREVIDPRRASDDRSIGQAPVHLAMVDARMGFSLTGRRTWRRLSPHLFVGGGIAYDFAGDGEVSEELLTEDIFEFGTSFTASLGTGLRVSLTSRLMLKADAGLMLWKLKTPGGFDDPTKRPVEPGEEPEALEPSEWVAGQGLMISLGWRF